MLDELKRVSSERDKLREELKQAKQNTKDAWDEVANLKNQAQVIGKAEVSERQSSESQTKQEASPGLMEDDPVSSTLKSPSILPKSRAGSITSMSLFSPRSKPIEPSIVQEDKEDFFSYDKELPRLETELSERQHKIDLLHAEVATLKGDLAVARESTQSMVESLEVSSRELHTLREQRDRSNVDLLEKNKAATEISDHLRADLAASVKELQDLKAEHSQCDPDAITELEGRLKKTQETLDNLRAEADSKSVESSQVKQLTLTIENMKKEMNEMSILETNNKNNDKKMNALNSLVSNLRTQLLSAEEEKVQLVANVAREEKLKRDFREQVLQLESNASSIQQTVKLGHSNDESQKYNPHPSRDAADDDAGNLDTKTAAKKRNKKKKKGVKSSSSNDKETLPAPIEEQENSQNVAQPISSTQEIVGQLQDELTLLSASLEEKNIMIDKLHGKIKQQDELHEEIETLRDDLVHVGQEHVETKEKAKNLLKEKQALELAIDRLNQEINEMRGTHALSTAGSEQKHEDLAKQFEELQIKATALQTDLSAAQQLASTRFKDLSEMRTVFQKAQPELIFLRSEVAESKSIRETLSKRELELERLDTKHEEMRVDVTKLKQRVAERDSEIKSLNLRISEETSSKLVVKDLNDKINQDVQRLETERRQASESLDRLAKDLSQSRTDLAASNEKLQDMDHKFSKTNKDNQILKEEIDLKTAQHASAQSLMGSMRDQTAEMAIQMKEARDRCDSLDEEVAEAHRLLSERGREGETMRRLLAGVESRADAKTREMKERMDTAIEERDRAEDEASTAGRRKAREMEDLRNRLREIERSLKRSEEDKEELELAQRDWKKRREELEHTSERHTQEVEEVRIAMGSLRDALDESERQAKELERQKAEMRRSVEDTQHRLEKLQKSNKVCFAVGGLVISCTANYNVIKSMADEIRIIQAAKAKVMDPETQSSRSSSDLISVQARRSSPVSNGRNSSVTLIDGNHGPAPSSIDYVYLKNVLLQFLEQKDKKHQLQLIPVLGMLLHFDR